MSALKRPPPAAALSTYMHAQYAAGASFNTIAARLNARGERGAAGGRWFAASVRLFLLSTAPGQPNQ